jgi:5-oxopent-3-ene-1,2,5-tricarboxylate decarboxylase/2-hydroxyhepta-2,4-diene-1,7-dioate isomerase
MSSSTTIPALLALRGHAQPRAARVDPADNAVWLDDRRVDASALAWDAPAIGCIYGTALNFRGLRASLEPVFLLPPHGAPPRAPVLYIKPRNTLLAHGLPVPLPAGVDAVEVGATLGVVIGRDATRVPLDRAADVVGGYTIVNDVTIPHSSLFRPPLRFKCRDGFCPIGPWVVARDALPSPDALGIRVYVNGELKSRENTANLHRSVAQLIFDVTEFMTLRAGDVLLVGVPENPPLARAGDEMAVEIDGIGRLENRLVPEEGLLLDAAS